jgi:hypothetical protein
MSRQQVTSILVFLAAAVFGFFAYGFIFNH